LFYSDERLRLTKRAGNSLWLLSVFQSFCCPGIDNTWKERFHS